MPQPAPPRPKQLSFVAAAGANAVDCTGLDVEGSYVSHAPRPPLPRPASIPSDREEPWYCGSRNDASIDASSISERVSSMVDLCPPHPSIGVSSLRFLLQSPPRRLLPERSKCLTDGFLRTSGREKSARRHGNPGVLRALRGRGRGASEARSTTGRRGNRGRGRAARGALWPK